VLGWGNRAGVVSSKDSVSVLSDEVVEAIAPSFGDKFKKTKEAYGALELMDGKEDGIAVGVDIFALRRFLVDNDRIELFYFRVAREKGSEVRALLSSKEEDALGIPFDEAADPLVAESAEAVVIDNDGRLGHGLRVDREQVSLE
jgi:hypothetical protein